MSTDCDLLISGCEELSMSALETGLLELFAPSAPPASPNRSEYAQLWSSDAIHRANNLAQLSVSLAGVAENSSRRWLSPAIATQARSLSRLFAELGIDPDPTEYLPCADMVTQVASRLTSIFGQARNITCKVATQAIYLPAEQRRALVLICSELVINALKYAFVSEAGGVICVRLEQRRCAIELVVEDNGTGTSKTYSKGHGGALIDELASLLGAQITRTCRADGATGYRISVWVPSSTTGACEVRHSSPPAL